MHSTNQHSYLQYLCVDNFLGNLVDTQTIKVAIENGLINYLVEKCSASFDELCAHTKLDAAGMTLLINLLENNNVLKKENHGFKLTADFKTAWKFRDLLEAKIEFANIVAPDVINLFSVFLSDTNDFMRQSSVFDLFGYHRCFEPTEENYALTKKWMKFTSAYTRYEAHACMHFHDFNAYKTHMDIGGNSGEFALQLCKKNHNLLSTIIDLPLVCDIGEEHVRSHPESKRIQFLKKDGLTHDLPKDIECVTFKSILHDWPEEATTIFIDQAKKSLAANGTLLIFERAPIKINQKIPYSMLPLFLFFRSFRSPEIYRQQLLNAGFKDIFIETIQLEMEFFIISAKK